MSKPSPHPARFLPPPTRPSGVQPSSTAAQPKVASVWTRGVAPPPQPPTRVVASHVAAGIAQAKRVGGGGRPPVASAVRPFWCADRPPVMPRGAMAVQCVLALDDVQALHQGNGPIAHAQGEHIFNAVDALALELAGLLPAMVNDGGDPAVVAAANVAIQTLANTAGTLAASRNNADFRTAAVGDPINANRYSGMANETRQLVRNICNGASAVTMAYTKLNRYLGDIEHYTIDQRARASKRQALHANRRNAFDAWFNATSDELYNTYRALRDAALAVARTHAQ